MTKEKRDRKINGGKKQRRSRIYACGQSNVFHVASRKPSQRERERERKRLSTECLHHRITHDRYREGCAPFYRARAVFSAGAFALASNYSLLTRADRKGIDDLSQFRCSISGECTRTTHNSVHLPI